jgi:pseudaminic acid biosynthesis-associated methylase
MQNGGSVLDFWAGDFGDEYHGRNIDLVDNNSVFFSKILPDDVSSLIEFGAGNGQNVRAIRALVPGCRITAVDINQSACELLKVTGASVVNSDIRFNGEFDMVLCKGILIHIPPYDLDRVYDVMYKSAKKYILLCEYYNPTPVDVTYRGNTGKLWKRDFAGEMLDRFPGLELVDYGFAYHRDKYPQDDITWFLLKKEDI